MLAPDAPLYRRLGKGWKEETAQDKRYSLKSSPTLRPSWERKMTSPKSFATVSMVMLGSIFSGEIGIVSVVTIYLIGRRDRRSTAGSERTAWAKER